MGRNTLGNTVKRMCAEGEIEGYFTNHSLRVTTATRALEKAIPEKLIMERTGHRSLSSLHQYQRTSTKVKEKVSDVLQGNLDSFLDDVEEPKRKKLCSEKCEQSNEDCGEGVSGKCVFSRCNFYFGKN